MIHRFSAALSEQLKLRKWNVPVFHGPEAFARAPQSTCLVTVRDGDVDVVGPSRGAAPNGYDPGTPSGRALASREIAGRVIVYAQSTAPNATRADHEELVDDLVDAIICAGYRWGVADRTRVSWGSGRVIDKAQYPGVFDRWPGIIYEQPLSVQRGVVDRDALGAGYPTVVIDRVETEVSDTTITIVAE